MIKYLYKVHKISLAILIISIISLITIITIAYTNDFSQIDTSFGAVYLNTVNENDYLIKTTLETAYLGFGTVLVLVTVYLFSGKRYLNMRKIIGRMHILISKTILLITTIVLVLITNAAFGTIQGETTISLYPYSNILAVWFAFLTIFSCYHLFEFSNLKYKSFFTKLGTFGFIALFNLSCYSLITTHMNTRPEDNWYFIETLTANLSSINYFDMPTYLTVTNFTIAIITCILSVLFILLIEYQKFSKKIIAVIVVATITLNATLIPFNYYIYNLKQSYQDFAKTIPDNVIYVTITEEENDDSFETYLQDIESIDSIEKTPMLASDYGTISSDLITNYNEIQVARLLSPDLQTLPIIAGDNINEIGQVVISSATLDRTNLTSEQLIGTYLGDYQIVGVYEQSGKVDKDVNYRQLGLFPLTYNYDVLLVSEIAYTIGDVSNLDQLAKTYSLSSDGQEEDIRYYNMYKLTFASDDPQLNMNKIPQFADLAAFSSTEISDEFNMYGYTLIIETHKLILICSSTINILIAYTVIYMYKQRRANGILL
ncbi:hypothetical protein RZE82_03410 [Mollicutes bacterium LVI A0039]|nr:hypothetical protein RZE82_03410 [Mollicutes bacterium LVI A0039]